MYVDVKGFYCEMYGREKLFRTCAVEILREQRLVSLISLMICLKYRTKVNKVGRQGIMAAL